MWKGHAPPAANIIRKYAEYAPPPPPTNASAPAPTPHPPHVDYYHGDYFRGAAEEKVSLEDSLKLLAGSAERARRERGRSRGFDDPREAEADYEAGGAPAMVRAATNSLCVRVCVSFWSCRLLLFL